MPATERRFDEVPPSHLYLDTNIPIAYIVATHEHHARCRPFIERLFERRTTIYLSPLTWMEYAHVMRQDFRALLPEQWRVPYRLSEWDDDTRVRQEYMRSMFRLLEDFLSGFDWVEIPLTDIVRRRSLEHVIDYNLQSQDAMHLAAAESVGVVDLASFDGSLRRVNGLYLWNDLIRS